MGNLGISVALTVVFAAIGIVSAWRWSGTLSGPAAPNSERVIAVNHLVMCVAMIVMVWQPIGVTGTLVQAAVFAGFAVLGLIGGLRAGDLRSRLAGLADTAMNTAMVWMLLAMPALMGVPATTAGSQAGHHGGHGSHGGHGESITGQSLPVASWISTTNLLVIMIMIGSLILQLVWTARGDRGRSHPACCAAMAAGMAAMLAVMA